MVSGVGDGQFTEVSAVARLFNDGIRLLLSCGNFIRGRVFRQRDQDVAQVKLGAGIVLVANLFCQRFDFLRQHGDTATHFIVTHFRNQHLFADLATVGVVVDAFIGQTAAHLIHGHVVLFGDVGDGLIELVVRDLHAHLLPQLQYDLVHDQSFEDLMAQCRVIRQLLASLTRIELN